MSECNYKPLDRANWANIDLYTDEEKYWNSSIFLDKHVEQLGHRKRSIFATVSSTVMISNHLNELFFYERVYDHTQQRIEIPYHRELAQSLIKNETLDFLTPDDFTNVDYIEDKIYH